MTDYLDKLQACGADYANGTVYGLGNGGDEGDRVSYGTGSGESFGYGYGIAGRTDYSLGDGRGAACGGGDIDGGGLGYHRYGIDGSGTQGLSSWCDPLAPMSLQFTDSGDDYD